MILPGIPSQGIVQFLVKYRSKAKFRTYKEMCTLVKDGPTLKALSRKQAVYELIECATYLLYVTARDSVAAVFDKLEASAVSVARGELLGELEAALEDLVEELREGGPEDEALLQERNEGAGERDFGQRVASALRRVEANLRQRFGNVPLADIGHG